MLKVFSEGVVISNNDFMENMSTQQFSFIIFVLLIFLVLITAFAFLTNTIWTIGLAFLIAFVTPPYVYIDVCVERRSLPHFVLMFIFVVISNYILQQYGPLWTPYLLFSLALFECLYATFFIGLISYLLSERYLKPKLKSNLVKKVKKHTLRPLADK
jgi:hypothetical protein